MVAWDNPADERWLDPRRSWPWKRSCYPKVRTFVGTTAAGSCLLTRLRRGCHRLEGSEDQVESERELVGGVVSGGEERCGGFVEVRVLVGG